MINNVLTDIEGTTSSLSFVKDVLFPYAARCLPEYIRTNKHQPQVQVELNAVAEKIQVSGSDEEAIIAALLSWIKEDKKETPLKNLQGLVWQLGYEAADYQAHMYADAVAWLQERKNEGLTLYVYSSGSVQAQKLFFQYSDHGDIRSLFSGHFDTTVGKKTEPEAFRVISRQCEIAPEETLFLSDVEAELDAAKSVGYWTARLLRSEDYGVTPTDVQSQHPVFTSFTEINLAVFSQ